MMTTASVLIVAASAMRAMVISFVPLASWHPSGDSGWQKVMA
jgi:hypothetical protein